MKRRRDGWGERERYVVEEEERQIERETHTEGGCCREKNGGERQVERHGRREM